ncbi:class I SAM-dependent methyltransferase [Roseivirga pacifica]|uniref:class I SAM-dependent methyltransferase n=1 Tax=Roseivirga pacifica TaxID=1267423 RepID=UPI002095BB45|nr:class I SAM-dependent methyltransferase [Roseivirga pacifica]MCO6358762.1 methyltransferase domain-containing protein [Roseivirga pacifica]MCO6365602.1 methyltransferase domain-containing protein [Roseivirga pacifica]MCO6371668.1 methyltransferase domain-containing protein [Roseivirga pacifica]MCO6376221.1 methyltransferase domain-containing protein [Roseivirga pacifica]MCO6379046.1 methyltransferase domain-containing protein [Roseivirga pacifica]
MKWTGERLVTHVDAHFAYEHLHRYYIAMQFANGKKVLDAACGEGYGSALLAQNADRVTGIDLSDKAIDHANEKYGDYKTNFVRADVYSLPFPEGEFDLIVCFETIEHVNSPNRAIEELKRVLSPDGLLIISTPDRDSKHHLVSKAHNPFHLKELNQEEFQHLINQNFINSDFLYQKTITASLITSGESIGELKEYSGWFDGYAEVCPKNNSQYMIGFCSDSSLPSVLSNSILSYEPIHKSLIKRVVLKIRNLFR